MLKCDRCKGSGRVINIDIMTRHLKSLVNFRVVGTFDKTELDSNLVKNAPGTSILNKTRFVRLLYCTVQVNILNKILLI